MHHSHLTFNLTVTLVFKGLSVFTSVFLGSVGAIIGGGLSVPSRSNTDCLFITFALLTVVKKKVNSKL